MKVSYTVHYSDTVYIPDSEWDQQTKIDYADNLNAFAFMYVQEDVPVFRGLTIDNIEGAPNA